MKAACIVILIMAVVWAIGRFESDRHVCEKCHRTMSPMQNFPSILECPCGFKVDITR